MSDDFKDRLRDTASQGVFEAIKNGRYASPHEAANRIEQLEAENARLREEVQSLTDELAYHGIYPR